jgi:Zn-dependent protease with chaperone function
MSTPDPAAVRSKFVLPNPETFFKAQARNRRATWRMSALCVFAALVMGIPLTLVLTPLLYALTLVAADIINYFSPLPPEFWRNVSSLSSVAYRTADYFINQRGTVDVNEIMLAAVLMLAPGMLLALFLWMGLRMLFRHGGVGGTLASLNAREPNPNDLKELQLADVVQEMAIAAGLPAPRLMLLDSVGANAAAIGSSPADARIVLSRRLIDDLDRDQLQALLAHMVGSISNGDLRIAFTVTSVFEACGLIIALVNAPFGKDSRKTLWRLLRYAFRSGGSDAKMVDAGEVGDLLADTLDTKTTDVDEFFNNRNAGITRKFFRLLLFPFIFTNIGLELTLFIFLQVLLGPCMALLWRTRRYLADASSVEFTRNPEALATALQQLSEDNNSISGAGWASHLFVVNPKGDVSLRGVPPPPAKQEKMLAAWRSTETTGYIPAVRTPDKDSTEWSRGRLEMMDTAKAAVTGNALAVARMQAFAKLMGSTPEFGFHNIPDVEDLQAASKGDAAAIERLRRLKEAHDRETGAVASRSQTGLQDHSFLSFHPPLGKRAKRLQKMGSRLMAPTNQYGFGLKIFMFVLYLIVVPLLVAAGVAMLMALAIMIMMNLMLLGLWLSVVHWAFGQDWVSNYQSFMKFADQIVSAISSSQHRR